MPTGWVAPSEGGESGGDEPVNPEPEPEPGVADGKSIATAYTFTTYSTSKPSGYPVMTFSGAENGATFTLESNKSSGYPTGLQKLNSGAWFTGNCAYTIGDETKQVNFDVSASYILGNSDDGFTLEYLYIVDYDGNAIYYKYDGTFNI